MGPSEGNEGNDRNLSQEGNEVNLVSGRALNECNICNENGGANTESHVNINVTIGYIDVGVRNAQVV